MSGVGVGGGYECLWGGVDVCVFGVDVLGMGGCVCVSGGGGCLEWMCVVGGGGGGGGLLGMDVCQVRVSGVDWGGGVLSCVWGGLFVCV